MNWNNYTYLKYPFDRPDFVMPFEKKAAKQIPIHGNILEIGSGPGRFVDLAFRHHARSVTSVDPRSNTHERIVNWSDPARKANEENRFNFICGQWPDAREQLDGHRFDLVFSQSALHYLDRDRRHPAFRQIRSVLKPGGIFALNLQSDDHWRIRSGNAVFVSEDRWLCDDGITRTYFTPESLIQELREAGFTVKPGDIRTRHISGYGAVEEESIWLETILQR